MMSLRALLAYSVAGSVIAGSVMMGFGVFKWEGWLLGTGIGVVFNLAMFGALRGMP